MENKPQCRLNWSCLRNVCLMEPLNKVIREKGEVKL